MTEAPQLNYIDQTVYTLLANLLGDEARSWEMAENKLEPDDLEHLPFARRVLEIIFYLENHNQAPTLDAVKRVLATNNEQAYIDQMDWLVSMRTEPPDLHHLSFVLKKIHLVHRKNLQLHQQIGEIFTSGTGLPAEQLDQAAALLTTHLQTAAPQRPLLSLFDLAQQRHDEIKALAIRAQNGLVLAPTWPWQSLRQLVPNMEAGDLHVFMAKSGWGKTAFALDLAEHWAWAQKKYNVMVMLFETTAAQMYNRQLAKHCGIPTSVLRTGAWTPETPGRATDLYYRFIEDRVENENLGMIHFQECPGWSPTEIEASVKAFMRMCEAEDKGREPVIIMDYFQKVETNKHWKYSNVPLNDLAGWLKTLAQRLKLYLMVMAQEHEAMHSEMPKGGDEILKQAQLVMRLQRHRADQDVPVRGANGSAVEDAFGNTRYWHRANGWASQLDLEVKKVNDGRTGTVPLRMEGAAFKIYTDDHRANGASGGA